MDFFYFLHFAGELKNEVSTNIDKRRIYIDLKGDRVFSVNNQYVGNSLGLKKLAFPSGCGKTCTAMLPGNTVVGDDIACLNDINGKVKAVNVENGKKKIDSLLLKKLADLYGYSIMYFLEEPEEHQELSIVFRTENLNNQEKEGVNWAKNILFNFNDLKEIKEEVNS